MIQQITDCLSQENANIENLVNKSKNDIAYTLIDFNQKISNLALQKISKIDGMIRITSYKGECYD